jgi:hypothetical protein
MFFFLRLLLTAGDFQAQALHLEMMTDVISSSDTERQTSEDQGV